MAKTPITIQLYDADITDLLNGWEADIALPRSKPDHLGVFENLREQELIYAISKKNFRRAYSLLHKLDHILSPTDAMAACLCALAGTTNLMNALLDHCPPIPEFQFQGVGLTASLLAVAAKYDKNKMLDILLQRGADPNGGPTPLTAKSPAEEAFCSGAYLSFKRLLELPDLQVGLTEEMLETWGNLRLQADCPFQNNILLLWCCQLMLERLTGQHTSPFDPLPIPKELQLGHALRHGNPELALRVCETRPLTEADIRDLEQHYTLNKRCTLLEESCSASLRTMHTWHVCILVHALEQFPHLLTAPWMRFAVASTALALPEPDEELQRWVARMADGPIPLHQLPFSRSPAAAPWLSPLSNFEKAAIHQAFFPRWDSRLGRRLTPSADRNTKTNWEGVSPQDLTLILERVTFSGDPPADRLSAVAFQALQWAPEDLLPALLRPGRLLGVESPRALLDACQELPPARRNLVLPHIRKETDYAL